MSHSQGAYGRQYIPESVGPTDSNRKPHASTVNGGVRILAIIREIPSNAGTHLAR